MSGLQGPLHGPTPKLFCGIPPNSAHGGSTLVSLFSQRTVYLLLCQSFIVLLVCSFPSLASLLLKTSSSSALWPLRCALSFSQCSVLCCFTLPPPGRDRSRRQETVLPVRKFIMDSEQLCLSKCFREASSFLRATVKEVTIYRSHIDKGLKSRVVQSEDQGVLKTW